MPDITMCRNKDNDCELKLLCYRYTCEPSLYWQSFFSEPPFDKESLEYCEYFISNDGEWKVKELK